MKKEIKNNIMYITKKEEENNNNYYEIEISYNYNNNNILYKSIIINTVERKEGYKTRSFKVYEDNKSIVIEKVKRKNTKKLIELINNYNNNILKFDLLMFMNSNMDIKKKEFIKNIIDMIGE